MINCEELKLFKEKFLQGNVSPGEEEAVELHLEGCPSCREMFDEWLAAGETNNIDLKKELSDSVPENELSEKKQRKILRRAKYSNRISIAFSLLLLFAVLSIAGSFLSSFYFNRGGENSQLYRAQKTAALLTEFSFPNVTMPMSFSPHPTFFSKAGWGHSSVEIKPYFVVTGSYAMQKQVGKESMVIGHLNVNHLFSSVLTQRQWKNGEYQHYLYFYHPDQLVGLDQYGERMADFSNEAWRVLEILPEGTVAELALSFRETYSLDQVKAILDDFDIDITWHAVATGVEGKSHLDRGNTTASQETGTSEDLLSPQTFPTDYNNTRHLEPLFAFNGAWGLPELSRNMLIQYSQIDSNDSALKEEYFLNSMEFLVKNERLAERLFQGNPRDLLLQERRQYLIDNGIKVYGVVVTGPAKELLKLQELENVHSPALGDVELWNWFHRSFSGTLY